MTDPIFQLVCSSTLADRGEKDVAGGEVGGKKLINMIFSLVVFFTEKMRSLHRQ